MGSIEAADARAGMKKARPYKTGSLQPIRSRRNPSPQPVQSSPHGATYQRSAGKADPEPDRSEQRRLPQDEPDHPLPACAQRQTQSDLLRSLETAKAISP